MIIPVQNHEVLILQLRATEPDEFVMLGWSVSGTSLKTICPVPALGVWDTDEWRDNVGVKRPDKSVLASDGSIHDTTDAWVLHVRARNKSSRK